MVISASFTKIRFQLKFIQTEFSERYSKYNKQQMVKEKLYFCNIVYDSLSKSQNVCQTGK